MSTKAIRYVQQLDEARCQGNWEAVPELVRKVRKHAPARTCLTMTAEAEHAIIQASSPRPSTVRPATARPSTANSSTEIAKYIPKLLDAIEHERTYVEDEFQAQVCLGWIHWQIGEPALAAGRLPKDVEQDFAQLDGTNKDSAEWTRVCALKASYIKGSSQIRAGEETRAMETFESALPIFATISSRKSQGKELRLWTELYLTAFCVLSSRLMKSDMTSILETEALSAFRAWATFWDGQTASLGGRAPQAEVSRRQVWKEYYFTLSEILQLAQSYPTTSLMTTHVTPSTRLQQRVELKRVEAKYESLLLNEVQFPRAEQASEEVETFVEIVMRNWRTMCGSSWTEQDLGEGGARCLSRGILDILYRAATKTFHSTTILRHLFTLHLAVAEFDLAFKAFDTYMEIVKKGKARVEKTGEMEHGLDDDETVLVTGAECIKALCRCGSREAAEKAQVLGHYFEHWLERHYPQEQQNGNLTGLRNGNANANANGKVQDAAEITPSIFALAWRCIGIAYANWARFTFDGSARGEIQQQAITCFKKSLRPAYESTADVATLYCLGTILAERREISVALQVVKSGLQPLTSSHQHATRFARERSLIPLWHLTALLLSARQEFTTAARSCEGAFEQFQDPKNLFGDADLNSSYRSDHLQMNEKSSTRILGIIDEMDDFEKEGVLEVKMTQLALVEILEGPEVAVNASDELLSLYARLFGELQKDIPTPLANTSALIIPPKSSAGTLRSIKGSIFGRSSRSIRKSQTAPIRGDRTTASRPQTQQTIVSAPAPVIQVTNENGNTAKQHHHLTKPDRRSASTSRMDGSASVRNRSTSTSRRHASNPEALENNPTTLDGEKYFTPPTDKKSLEESNPTTNEPPAGFHPVTPKIQLAVKDRSNPTDSDPTLVGNNWPPRISLPSASTTPLTQSTLDQARRKRMTILIRVWLLISGFYRRAAMYEDAKGAIEEADKLVSSLDAEVSQNSSRDLSITNSGWGGDKSVSQLWGDVFSERGYLAVAESNPYPAMAHFEAALTHFHDHPSAVVGLSNLLLDIYNKDLLPPPTIPSLVLPRAGAQTPSASTTATQVSSTTLPYPPSISVASFPPHGPIGISTLSVSATHPPPTALSPVLPSSDSEDKTNLHDRIAARDRASFLLSSLTKLGSGWNSSEAWFALARAYELQGQADKAKEVLWWVVELEDAKSVRDWGVLGGYVL